MFQLTQLHNYIVLSRLNKPIGIFLLLWPTVMALWIAGKGSPSPFLVFIFIAGVIVMRSAGCVINDLLDHRFDGSVTRTRFRPLVMGAVTVREAWVLFLILTFVALLLVLQLNTFTIVLSSFALLLAMIYPLMKRVIHWPQVVLGCAFGWAIPMAFAAQTNHVYLEAFILFFASVCWAVVYDTQYAMADRADDIKIGVKSTAILFGEQDKILIASFQFLVITLLIILGLQLQLGLYYYLGVITATLLFLYQQYLIKDRVVENCLQAFRNNHYVGFALFVGLALEYALGG